MKVKICGITNVFDARFAIESGADLIGFVFYKRSPRYVSPSTVKDILKKIPQDSVTVGVFVNEISETMVSIYRFCGLHTLQLHGQESLNQVEQLGGINLIKAFALNTEHDLKQLEKFRDYTLLIDSPSNEYGGTGKTANWELARTAASNYRIFLAGGLNSENVADSIRVVKPYGVDVSSGVEKVKGVKDSMKVKNFIEIIRDLENRDQ